MEFPLTSFRVKRLSRGREELIEWLIRDMKPYLDFLRDYDRGKVGKEDLKKLSG